jgi:hypothetical protein
MPIMTVFASCMQYMCSACACACHQAHHCHHQQALAAPQQGRCCAQLGLELLDRAAAHASARTRNPAGAGAGAAAAAAGAPCCLAPAHDHALALRATLCSVLFYLARPAGLHTSGMLYVALALFSAPTRQCCIDEYMHPCESNSYRNASERCMRLSLQSAPSSALLTISRMSGVIMTRCN